MTQTHRQRISWLAAPLLAGVLTAAVALAAEDAPPEAAEPQTPAAAAAGGATQEPPADAADEPGTQGGVEVFVPSEEISEDFAVSFPVDI